MTKSTENTATTWTIPKSLWPYVKWINGNRRFLTQVGHFTEESVAEEKMRRLINPALTHIAREAHIPPPQIHLTSKTVARLETSNDHQIYADILMIYKLACSAGLQEIVI